ncbi:hypothetical protein SH1V18_38730 [Vallitalea longa]|uniref:Uncharacterized protein n=1 Tax=Vallitalea longa TaxID=2936439 RepID=A0A9W5YHM5_9FIRM|nr:hypothetical protein [Vallitalea longa]GKX31393.1 hypothetical protein SH1V18_38730 [Vallitalea longa]
MHGIVFKNDNCKCFSCLYLMTYIKTKDEFGNENIKIYCMLNKCIFNKREKNDGKK